MNEWQVLIIVVQPVLAPSGLLSNSVSNGSMIDNGSGNVNEIRTNGLVDGTDMLAVSQCIWPSI